MDEITIGKPVKDLPPAARNRPNAQSRLIMDACAQLKDGDLLPVECADADQAKALYDRAHGKNSAIYRAGIRVSRRGTTLYFYRNGTH